MKKYLIAILLSLVLLFICCLMFLASLIGFFKEVNINNVLIKWGRSAQGRLDKMSK